MPARQWVDTYHFGLMAGLGTPHGVILWGDGAMVARVGQAAFRRFYYYLAAPPAGGGRGARGGGD